MLAHLMGPSHDGRMVITGVVLWLCLSVVLSLLTGRIIRVGQRPELTTQDLMRQLTAS
jgi:hypothetical protein